MSKHDRSKQEKKARNHVYAEKYRQRRCSKCGHRSCRSGNCALCGGSMKKHRKGNGGAT